MIDAKITELAQEIEDIKQEIINHYCTINNIPVKETWDLHINRNYDRDGMYSVLSPDAETLKEIRNILAPSVYTTPKQGS